MKKAACVLMFLLVALCPFSVQAEDTFEEDFTQAIDDALKELDLGGMAEYYSSESDALAPITQGISLEQFITDMASGKLFIDYGSVGEYFLAQLRDGFKNSLPFLIEILVISLLFSLLSVFYPDFGGVHKAAEYARYILICGITVSVFLNTFNMANDAIARITSFTTEFFPVLFFLLTSIGGIAGASILKPATSALTGFISVFTSGFISPLLVLMCSVTVLSGFATRFKLNGMRELIKSVIKWAIGISFVLFLGCVTLQGLVSSSFDGITLKAAKYTIDKAIPIVGGVFSDTMDMIIASSLLIKNAVGVCGILIIVSMLLSPAVTLWINYFMLKLAGAIVEPLNGEDTAKFLKGMSDVILMQNAVLIISGSMFLINIGLVLGSGNINIMLR